MRVVILISVSTGLAFYASCVLGAVTYCAKSDVCFQWGVPQSAVTSGSGDVYLQIQAPASYQWLALGIGSRMSGAKMFVIYQDGNGNVTLSPRTCSGHNMPTYEKRSEVSLIDGSDVSNGTMVANIRCGDCTSLDLSGSNSWIAAWKKGSALNSVDPSQNINEHDGYTSLNVDFSKAVFSASGNPFTNPTLNSSSSSSGVSAPSSNTDHISNAHGIIMAITFLLAYPVGGVLMPILGKWLIHAAWQIVAFLGMWVGFGLGYIVSCGDGSWLHDRHTILGLIICCLLTAQPLLGWFHHLHYVKYQRRGTISYGHIWFGRILMLVGVVNGGLGLKLAQSSSGYIIGYSLIAVVMAAVYVGIKVTVLSKKTEKRSTYLLSSENPSSEGYRMEEQNYTQRWAN